MSTRIVKHKTLAGLMAKGLFNKAKDFLFLAHLPEHPEIIHVRLCDVLVLDQLKDIAGALHETPHSLGLAAACLPAKGAV